MKVRRVCVCVATATKKQKITVCLTNFHILIILNHVSRHKGQMNQTKNRYCYCYYYYHKDLCLGIVKFSIVWKNSRHAFYIPDRFFPKFTKNI